MKAAEVSTATKKVKPYHSVMIKFGGELYEIDKFEIESKTRRMQANEAFEQSLVLVAKEKDPQDTCNLNYRRLR